MTALADGKRVACNGGGCEAVAFLPVGLRQIVAVCAESTEMAANGWLFIRSNEVWQHYCPQCGRLKLLEIEPANPSSSSKAG